MAPSVAIPGRWACGVPLRAPSMVPPQFGVETKLTGRLLTTVDNYSVYASSKDRPDQSNCNSECLQDWKPIVRAGVREVGRRVRNHRAVAGNLPMDVSQAASLYAHW